MNTLKESISDIIELAKQYENNLPSQTPVRGIKTGESISSWIDHTLLKPEATPAQIQVLCQEAVQYQFASVCVNSLYVPLAYSLLKNSQVDVCGVVGFPLGAVPATIKTAETRYVVENGAKEVDMVIAIGLLKAGEYERVLDDIQMVVDEAYSHKVLVKVILEMASLNQYEKIIGCLLCQKAGANFVKTSTGFGTGGATVEDVQLMHRVVGQNLQVKAAGGIRSYQDAYTMIQAGADRLGTSAGIKIIQESMVKTK